MLSGRLCEHVIRRAFYVKPNVGKSDGLAVPRIGVGEGWVAPGLRLSPLKHPEEGFDVFSPEPCEEGNNN